MSEETEEWVCLKCFNRWEPRKPPDDKAQCSNVDCKSRLTVRLDPLKENVESVQGMMEKAPYPLGEFLNPPTGENLFDFFTSGKSILGQADPRFPEGVDVFQSVLELAKEAEDEKKIEEAIARLAEEKEAEN